MAEKAYVCGCPRSNSIARDAGLFGVRRSISLRTCRLGEHEHREARIILTLGGCFETRHGAWRTMVDVGNALYRPANDMHRDAYNEPTVSLGVLVSSPAERWHALGTRPFVVKGDALASLASAISWEIEQTDSASALVLDALCAELIGHLRQGTALEKSRPSWIRSVRNRIEETYLRPPSLCEIAVDADREPSYVATVFKKQYGTTIGAHVRELRVRHARKLLAETGISLADIANLCGFADQSHFARFFKRRFAIAPGEYRRRLGRVREWS